MLLKNLSIRTIITFVSLLYFQGCSDDTATVNPSKINVTGKVTTLLNQGNEGLQVKIGNQVTTTAADGSFTINNITAPYDLQITQGNASWLYKGISSSEIIVPDFGSAASNLTATMSVTVPPEIFQPGVSGKVMFTDKNYVNAYGEISANAFPFDIYLPDNSPVSGSLIVVTYRKDNSDNIISYENFGESSSIQVSPGGQYTYNFSLAELSLNPGESTIEGDFVVPNNYTSTNQFLRLSFASKRTQSFLYTSSFSVFNGNHFILIVPTGLPLQYTTLVGNLVSNSSNNSINTIESYKVPGNSSGIQLEGKIPPALINPPDNATNVDLNTPFTFTSENGEGIYFIYFTDITNGKAYTLVIEANSLTLASLNELTGGAISNASFSWTVEKRGTSSSVNDYLTSFTDHPGSYRTAGETRNFSTAP